MNYSDLFFIMFVTSSTMFGIVFGSFLNVVIYRIPASKTIVKGHSMCMTCGHTLGVLDLVPILSWLFLGGKCRYCKAPIASRYCKIECFTGLCFLLTALNHREITELLLQGSNKFLVPQFAMYCTFLLMICCVISVMMIFYDTRKAYLQFPLIILISRALVVLIYGIYVGDITLALYSIAIFIIMSVAFIAIPYIVIRLVKANYSKVDFLFDFAMGTALTFVSQYAYVNKFEKIYTFIPLLTFYTIVRLLTKDKKYEKYMGILCASIIVLLLASSIILMYLY